MRSRMNARARPGFAHTNEFEDYHDEKNIHESMVGLLNKVWRGAPSSSFMFVAAMDSEGRNWRESVIRADDITLGLKSFFVAHCRWNLNLYFCPNPFAEPRRKRQHALQTRLGWCDMDGSNPWVYRPQASLVWETSPDRYQALWLWKNSLGVAKAESVSRALAERHGGDSGWSITKMLRIPGSINHKPQYDEPFVRLVHQDWMESRPEVAGVAVRTGRSTCTKLEFDHTAFKATDIVNKYRRDLDPKSRALMRNKKAYESDRSNQIFHIVVGLHEVGATLDEIASVVWASPYFQEKYPDDIRALNAELSRIMSKLGDVT